jgi:GNAT superfamily N-acetyltransferase
MEFMSAIMIDALNAKQFESQKEQILHQLREIFFESSTRKEFKDEEEREAFYWKYMGLYLHHFPQWVFLAYDKKVLGYVLGAPVSDDPVLKKIQPHLQIFAAQLDSFPAHLHINCHAASRGQGVGARLVQRFEQALQEAGFSGLHIMTSPDALNRSFYQKLGFDYESEGHFHGAAILFMGKTLT